MTTEEKCFALTASFEGGGYTALSGNFDGQGVSFGFLQWNFGRGTLQPLLRAMHEAGPATFHRCCFQDVQGNKTNLMVELLRVCSLPPAEAVRWAADRQDDGGRFRTEYSHWVKVFRSLGSEPGFQGVQRQRAEPYMATARAIAGRYGWKSERGLALAFDIAVQMGSVGLGARGRYFSRTAGKGLGELAQLAAMATAIAPQGGPWARDVLARKMAIATGAGIVHGHSYHIERDFGITMGAIAR